MRNSSLPDIQTIPSRQPPQKVLDIHASFGSFLTSLTQSDRGTLNPFDGSLFRFRY